MYKALDWVCGLKEFWYRQKKDRLLSPTLDHGRAARAWSIDRRFHKYRVPAVWKGPSAEIINYFPKLKDFMTLMCLGVWSIKKWAFNIDASCSSNKIIPLLLSQPGIRRIFGFLERVLINFATVLGWIRLPLSKNRRVINSRGIYGLYSQRLFVVSTSALYAVTSLNVLWNSSKRYWIYLHSIATSLNVDEIKSTRIELQNFL